VRNTSSEPMKQALPENYNESYREPVDRGCAAKRNHDDSVAAHNGIDRHSCSITMATTPEKEEISKPHKQQYNRSNSCYSATLGINSMDLSRKSLSEDRFAGTSFTPQIVNLTSTGNNCEPHPLDKAEEGLGGAAGAPFSPASLSASLGITTIKPSSRTAAARRHRDRSRTRQRLHPPRGWQNENRPPFVADGLTFTGDSSNSMFGVRSGDGFENSSPLPPLLKIVEKNVAGIASSNHTHFNPSVVRRSPKAGDGMPSSVITKEEVPSDPSKATSKVAEDPGCLAGCAGSDATEEQDEDGKVANFGASQENSLRRSQWFKSPWKRGMVFTPIKGDKLTRWVCGYVLHIVSAWSFQVFCYTL